MRREHLEAWAEQTTASFAVRLFPGGHFYIAAEPGGVSGGAGGGPGAGVLKPGEVHVWLVRLEGETAACGGNARTRRCAPFWRR